MSQPKWHEESEPASPTIDSLTEQILALQTKTFREGMEAGMWRLQSRHSGMIDRSCVQRAIQALDEEFDHTCPHEQHGWENGGCRRCGFRDPLASTEKDE